MGLNTPTILDGKPADISRCRARMNSAGITECTMEARCQWALRVGHSIGLAMHSLWVCRHPSAKQIAESTENNVNSVRAG